MASKGAKQNIQSAYGSNRKRFFSDKFAPLAEFIPKDFGGKVSLPPPVPSVRNLAVALAVYLAVGTICFYSVLDEIKGNKENPMIDSLYFTVTTMTTVGYGDLVPNNTSVKVLCCLFVVIGMALFGLIMSKAADYIVEKQEMLLVKALSKDKKYGPYNNNEMNKCLLAVAVLSIYMLVGTIYLYTFEGVGFIDSLYCICTTITTVGYGDKAFASAGGRFFAVIWILMGTFGLGQLYMYVVELVTESRQKALVTWLLTRRMTNLVLNAADFDNVEFAEGAKFAVHKLKAMGKISQEDISRLMEEFEDLDVHKCGFLSASDLVFAQSKR